MEVIEERQKFALQISVAGDLLQVVHRQKLHGRQKFPRVGPGRIQLVQILDAAHIGPVCAMLAPGVGDGPQQEGLA